MRRLPETKRSFEETYPLYPFSELVRLAVALAQWLAGRRLRRDDARRGERRPQQGPAAGVGGDSTVEVPGRREDLAA